MFPISASPEHVTSRPSPLERWLERLGKLFPLTRLVVSSPVGEPVHDIGLPDAEPVEDTSTISAYYLSFYE